MASALAHGDQPQDEQHLGSNCNTPVLDDDDGDDDDDDDWAKAMYDQDATTHSQALFPRLQPGSSTTSSSTQSTNNNNLFSFDSETCELATTSMMMPIKLTTANAKQRFVLQKCFPGTPAAPTAARQPHLPQHPHLQKRALPSGGLPQRALPSSGLPTTSSARRKPSKTFLSTSTANPQVSRAGAKNKDKAKDDDDDDGDLVASMAARLAHLERAQKQYRLQLVKAERELLQLRRYRDAHRVTSASKVLL
jgi:hypothetical protein